MAWGDIVVGLDIGTTKVAVLVGKVDPDGMLNIIGIGTSPSKGLRKGVVVDIDSTVKSIREAVDKAQRMAGIEIRSVYMGVTGGHISSLSNRGVVAVAREDREITAEDVARVLEAARVIGVPPDREIIHVLPREFIVDGYDGIRDPVGMVGIRLEVEAQIITGSMTSLQNLLRSVEKAGLEVDDVVLNPLASGEAVLLPAERDLGVVVADIGGGTVDVAAFYEGSLCYASVIPVGGEFITSDIAVGLRTPLATAEEIKLEHGCALSDLARDDLFFKVGSVGGQESREVSQKILAGIIEPRVQEILEMVGREIEASGYEKMIPGGVVLTGGSSALKGLGELASRQFGFPVRVGTPADAGGLGDMASSGSFATSLGILRYAARDIVSGRTGQDGTISGMVGSILKYVRNWFRDLF